MEVDESCDQVCRLCDKVVHKSYSLFDKNEQGQQIIHLVKECLPVVVYRTDPLPKQICEQCLENLNALSEFKKISEETAEKHKDRLKLNGDTEDKSIQLYLGCQEENGKSNESLQDESNNKGTNQAERIQKDIVKMKEEKDTTDQCVSTDDLTVLCSNCRSEVLDAHKVNSEVELCAELHQAIADSFNKNKIACGGSSGSEKVLRSRRRRTQTFYQELEDSTCSSLTEFTNTESSQCYDFQSDKSEVDSVDSEHDEVRPTKRRRLEVICKREEPVKEESYQNLFKEEEEYRYYPLRLTVLCLNVINKINLPDYEPDDFKFVTFGPTCSYCNQEFKNSKLLAIHEISHMNIEMGEKVDNPKLWHESRDDADVRNKWLSIRTETEDEDEIVDIEGFNGDEESLLIPVGSDLQDGEEPKPTDGDIELIEGKPYVNGVPLSDYSKEERKAFYHSMRIGGINKRFCLLCRYSFKDNWAIESHYFSLACYFTCKYCGMRFNKQRNRYAEHVREHEINGDAYSTKVFAASKNNNVVPKVVYPKKKYEEIRIEPAKIKTILERKSLQPNLRVVKDEMRDDSDTPPSTTPQPSTPLQTSQSKTGNQAYFCRKCYKVFFKLDEFNIHSKNCDHNQFPSAASHSAFNHSIKSQNGGEVVSRSTGRPMRNCAKEAGPYRDELYLPDSILKEPPMSNSSNPPQSYVCYICNTPFPTIYSRNSHMRIHKADTLNVSGGPSNNQNKFRPLNQSPHNQSHPQYQQHHQQQQHQPLLSVASFAQVKQEPLEPEVEIHEASNQEDYTNSLGPAVSITPISKNPQQRLNINPSVMKLVQSNPQLSIKTREPQNMGMNQMNMMASSPDVDRSYKCSSCWEAFANKSHLYFHKKNQCEGSKYPCPFCKKRFGTEAAYSSHIFYSHPE